MFIFSNKNLLSNKIIFKMEILSNKFSKDLVNIIKDYAIDTGPHDRNVHQLNKLFKELNYCIDHNLYSDHMVHGKLVTIGKVIFCIGTKTMYTYKNFIENRGWKAWLLFHKRKIFPNNFYHNNVCRILQKLNLIMNINKGVDLFSYYI